jgi:hypothetical protein
LPEWLYDSVKLKGTGRMARAKVNGIFCLETGDWWGDLKKPSTVKPVLELLAQSHNKKVPFVHRDVATRPELEYYLKLWTKRAYQRYPILYLSFHGVPGEIGDWTKVLIGLDELEDLLRGKCKRRVIHFGSCNTLALHGIRINRFVRETKALAVSGYTGYIDWNESTAFEILLLSQLATGTALASVAGPKAVNRRLTKLAPGLCEHLNFRLVAGKPVK